jgi:hypothetical protein
MKALIVVLAVAVLFLLAAAALAQPDSPYALVGWTTASGGVMASADGRYSVAATAGDPSAGPPMSGGQFGVTGGFVAASGSPASAPRLYLPAVLSE